MLCFQGQGHMYRTKIFLTPKIGDKLPLQLLPPMSKRVGKDFSRK